MNISVNYDDTDVAKALSKIIKDPNAEQFVKLLTPMLCSSSQGADHFFKLMIGNKLPEVIPNGTYCKVKLSNISYGIDKELTAKQYADEDNRIICTVQEFRGYHEYSQYVITYKCIATSGTEKLDTTYVRDTELEIVEDF